jgi:AraC-like DNA-binding protein
MAYGRDGRHQVIEADVGAGLFDWWREEVSSTFVPLDALPNSVHGVSRFTGDLISGSVGDLRICEVSGREVDVRRTRATIRRGDPGFVKLAVQLRGRGVVVQHDRSAVLVPGDFTVYDTSQPYDLHFDNDFSMFVLMFSRESLKITSRNLDAVLAQRIRGDDGLGALASPFLCSLRRGLPPGGLSTTPVFEGGVLDIVSAALEEKTPRANAAPGFAILGSAKAFIDTHLADPALNTSMVAAAQHISPRYLQKLFEAENLTVAGWIRAKRLDRSRRDLEDRSLASVSIATICSRHGLVDPAHFSRLFKETYGMSPRAFRNRPHP